MAVVLYFKPEYGGLLAGISLPLELIGYGKAQNAVLYMCMKTALHEAARNGYAEAVEVPLEKDANIERKQTPGKLRLN